MATTATATKVKVVAYVDWSAIIAGTILALTVSVVLAHFGSALGFTYDRFAGLETTNSEELWHHFLILGLWTLWTQLMASMAGGYAAGVVRRGWIGPNHEAEVRDGAHGLMVWALSTILVFIAGSVAAFWTTLDPDYVAPAIRLGEATAEKMGLVWGFSMAGFSLVSAVAAWWTGTLGGDHRDRSIDVSEHISFRPRKK